MLMQEWIETWGPAILQILVALLILGWTLQATKPKLLSTLMRVNREVILVAKVTIVIVGGGIIYIGLTAGKHVPLYIDWSAITATWLALGTLTVGIAAYQFLRFSNFDLVVEQTTRFGLRYSDRLAARGKSVSGWLLGFDAVRNTNLATGQLGILGEVAADDDKLAVLKALGKIASTLGEVDHRAKWVSNSLVQGLLKAIRRTVTLGTPADYRSYTEAIRILVELKLRFEAKSFGPESERVHETIERIARNLTARAVDEPALGLEAALRTAIDALSQDSKSIFWIGIQCARHFPVQGTLPVLGCLTETGAHLEGLEAKHVAPKQAELDAMLLGLAAALQREGPSRVLWVERAFKDSGHQHLFTLENLTAARDQLIDMAHFEAADAVEEWRANWEEAKRKRETRNAEEPSVSSIAVEFLRRVIKISVQRRKRSHSVNSEA